MIVLLTLPNDPSFDILAIFLITNMMSTATPIAKKTPINIFIICCDELICYPEKPMKKKYIEDAAKVAMKRNMNKNGIIIGRHVYRVVSTIPIAIRASALRVDCSKKLGIDFILSDIILWMVTDSMENLIWVKSIIANIRVLSRTVKKIAVQTKSVHERLCSGMGPFLQIRDTWNYYYIFTARVLMVFLCWFSFIEDYIPLSTC